MNIGIKMKYIQRYNRKKGTNPVETFLRVIAHSISNIPQIPF